MSSKVKEDISEDENIARKIMEAVKPILPKGGGFIMITQSPHDYNIDITSNLPDDVALEFLASAVRSIKTTPQTRLEGPEESKASKDSN